MVKESEIQAEVAKKVKTPTIVAESYWIDTNKREKFLYVGSGIIILICSIFFMMLNTIIMGPIEGVFVPFPIAFTSMAFVFLMMTFGLGGAIYCADKDYSIKVKIHSKK